MSTSAAASLDVVPERHRAVAAERVSVLCLVEQLATEHGITAAVGIAAKRTGVGASSIRRWRSDVADRPKTEWAAVLAPRWRGRPSTEDCDQEAWQYLLGAYLRPEQPSFRDSYRRTRDVARVKGWNLPSEKVLRARFERDVPCDVALLRRRGADALESAYPAQIRDRSGMVALEAVNADGHRFDVQVEWPDGSHGRPMMVAWQDLYSGKVMSWRVDRNENAAVVRLALGDMVEQYGIPGHAYLDNGRGFASRMLSGRVKHRYRFRIKDEEPAGAFKLLGIDIHWTTPYHGQAKPIERAFRDLCETVAKHPSFSGAYTGRSPLHKPANYGTRIIPLADFLRVVELEIKSHNARPERRTRVCAGRLSFDAAFAASYAETPIRKVTDDQRRLLLLAADGLKVRKGGLHLLGNQFWCPEISSHQGRPLIVRFDPERVQAGVYCYDTDGRYIGFAECSSAVGFADISAAREHNRKRRTWTRAVKQAAKELDAASPAEVGSLHLDALEAEVGAVSEPRSKVVRPEFNRPKTPERVARTASDDAADAEQDALVLTLGRAAREKLNAEAV